MLLTVGGVSVVLPEVLTGGAVNVTSPITRLPPGGRVARERRLVAGRLEGTCCSGLALALLTRVKEKVAFPARQSSDLSWSPWVTAIEGPLVNSQMLS